MNNSDKVKEDATTSQASEASTASPAISSPELDRFCDNPVVVTNEEPSGCTSSTSTIISSSGGSENSLVSMTGGKPIFLSDQFTAVLIKPESLLYGLEVPLIKKEPGEVSTSDIITVPTASILPSETVSVAQIPWLVPLTQDHKAKAAGSALFVPHQTSPDSASATPEAPYMFECKDRAFTCEFCPNIRFTRGQLRRHKAVHQGQRNYSCDVCGKRFAWKHSLLKHTVLHTGQSPFICPQCGKGFAAAHHLQHHIKSHDTERQYQCTSCDKTFVRPDELIMHARTHAGEETFACEVCDKGFTSKFALSTHLRVHGEPSSTLFSCAICGKQFSFYKGLLNHAKVHSDHPEAAVAEAGGRVVIVSGKDVTTLKPGFVPTTQSGLAFVTDPSGSTTQIVIDPKILPEVVGQEVPVHNVEIQQSVL